MNYQNESALQELAINELVKTGYTYVGSHLALEDVQSIFLKKITELNTEKLPEGLSLNEQQRLLSSLPLNMRDAFSVLRHGLTLPLDNNKMVNLTFFDKNDLSKNTFQVMEELNIKGVTKTRLDLVLLMNGIPIMNIELKRKGVGHGVDEAISQINRYNKAGVYRKNLLNFVQVFAVSNNVFTRYFAASPRATQNEPYNKAFYWTDKNNKRINQLSDFIASFCEPEHLANIIREYMILTPVDGSNDSMILRPYQIYAVEAAKKQMLETSSNCFIWHATGSGKTLTSYMLGQALANDSKFGKVIMLLDRNDLADQTIKEYRSFASKTMKDVKRGRDLHKEMTDKNQKFIMTTHQSFARWLSKYPKTATQLGKQNISFIVDECHRTTFGKMFQNIRKAFPKAQFVGFSGTPRLAENPTDTNFLTKDIFGQPAHIYTIKNAIDDKNVLPFSMHEVKVTTTKPQHVKNKTYYRSEERKKAISNHIINNLWKNTAQKNKIKPLELEQPVGYTAMLATQGKYEAYSYWQTLAPFLAEQNRTTALVFSIEDNVEDKGFGTQHDWFLEALAHYDATFDTSFVEAWGNDRAETVKAHLRDVTTRVKNQEIDLIIVSDMLLTGFDSQTLNTIYLDKDLKHHNLLQAMSRVNRVHSRSGKQHGNVVIFSDRDMNEKVDNAISLFSNGENVKGVVERKNYKELYNETVAAVKALQKKVDVPEDISNIEKAEELLEVASLFSKVKTLTKQIQTFDEWEEADWKKLGISEDNIEEYYAHIYEQRKRIITDDTSLVILEELDFQINSITEYVINVEYINQLLNNGIYAPKTEREKWWRKARKAIDISDDPDVIRNKEALLETVAAAEKGIVSNTEELFEKLDETKTKIEALKYATYAEVFKVSEEQLRTWVSISNSTGHIPRELIVSEVRKQGVRLFALDDKVNNIVQIIEKEFSV